LIIFWGTGFGVTIGKLAAPVIGVALAAGQQSAAGVVLTVHQ
jgi:hypothetical protein